MNEPEWITGSFEGEVWLSTDGKNTVRILAKDEAGRLSGLMWAKKTYEELIAKYKTKQEINKETYQNGNGASQTFKKEQDKEMQEGCAHQSYKVAVVKKDGPNQGKQFKSCNNCKKFLGFI